MNASSLPDIMESVIVDRINVGLLAVDRDARVSLWNRFMATHSGIDRARILGRSLFEFFPEIDQRWLTRKLDSVFTLGNYAFTSNEQRPWLFRFQHGRPITGTTEFMQQDCTFLPVKDEAGTVTHVCIAVFDVTDASMYRALMNEALQAKEELSIRDTLTGLYNRRYLESTLTREFKRARRYDQPLSVLMADVDHFKHCNDTYGHSAGDAILATVGECMTRVLRSSDTVGRYGGEEFVMVLPETTLADARKAGERLRHVIETTQIPYHDETLAVTISIGASTLDSTTSDCEHLLNAADQAMYQAKSAGRNRVVAGTAADDAHADGQPTQP